MGSCQNGNEAVNPEKLKDWRIFNPRRREWHNCTLKINSQQILPPFLLKKSSSSQSLLSDQSFCKNVHINNKTNLLRSRSVSSTPSSDSCDDKKFMGKKLEKNKKCFDDGDSNSCFSHPTIVLGPVPGDNDNGSLDSELDSPHNTSKQEDISFRTEADRSFGSSQSYNFTGVSLDRPEMKKKTSNRKKHLKRNRLPSPNNKKLAKSPKYNRQKYTKLHQRKYLKKQKNKTLCSSLNSEKHLKINESRSLLNRKSNTSPQALDCLDDRDCEWNKKKKECDDSIFDVGDNLIQFEDFENDLSLTATPVKKILKVSQLETTMSSPPVIVLNPINDYSIPNFLLPEKFTRQNSLPSDSKIFKDRKYKKKHIRQKRNQRKKNKKERSGKTSKKFRKERAEFMSIVKNQYEGLTKTGDLQGLSELISKASKENYTFKQHDISTGLQRMLIQPHCMNSLEQVETFIDIFGSRLRLKPSRFTIEMLFQILFTFNEELLDPLVDWITNILEPTEADLLKLFELMTTEFCTIKEQKNLNAFDDDNGFEPWRCNYILHLCIEDYGLHLENLPDPEASEYQLNEFAQDYCCELLFKNGWEDMNLERYACIYDIVQECWDNFLSSDFGRDQFLRFSESLDKLLLPIDLDVVCHVIAEFLIGISSNSFTTCASLERRRSSNSLHNTNINMKLKEKGTLL